VSAAIFGGKHNVIPEDPDVHNAGERPVTEVNDHPLTVEATPDVTPSPPGMSPAGAFGIGSGVGVIPVPMPVSIRALVTSSPAWAGVRGEHLRKPSASVARGSPSLRRERSDELLEFREGLLVHTIVGGPPVLSSREQSGLTQFPQVVGDGGWLSLSRSVNPPRSSTGSRGSLGSSGIITA
jgi:hypothetical protein